MKQLLKATAEEQNPLQLLFRTCPSASLLAAISERSSDIREAIALHLEGMREDGEQIPDPHTAVAYIDLQEVG